MSMRGPADLVRDLERAGEQTVKARFLNGDYRHPEIYQHVKDWLSAKESERADAREEENLSNSRRALRISQWAMAIAIIAMLFSAAVAIIIAWVQRK